MYKRPMAQFNLSAFELLSEIIEFEGDMVGTEHFDEDHGEFDQKNNLDYFSCIINTKTFILEFLEKPMLLLLISRSTKPSSLLQL